MKAEVVYKALSEIYQGQGLGTLMGEDASKVVTFMKGKGLVETLKASEYEKLFRVHKLKERIQECTEQANALDAKLNSRRHIFLASVSLAGPYLLREELTRVIELDAERKGLQFARDETEAKVIKAGLECRDCDRYVEAGKRYVRLTTSGEGVLGLMKEHESLLKNVEFTRFEKQLLNT